jgi:peptidyl-prolyl cis-trans isomerase SurA
LRIVRRSFGAVRLERGNAGKDRVRTLPKTAFLLRIVVTALPTLGALAIGTAPLLAQGKPTAQTQAKPTAQTKLATTEAAPPSTPVMTEADVTDDSVAAVVNDDIVTEYDLEQRLALVIATSGMQAVPDVVKKLKPQVLEQLKTEKLELQESKRKNITVSPPEVDKEIEGILKDNHLTLAQLKDILARDKVDVATLRAQIAVQLAWQKAIEDEYGDRINITPADVDDELARIAEGANKPHYQVSEIFVPVENADQSDKALKSATDLSAQLQNGAPFASIARQFSQSPSAAQGGDIGWVNDGQLAPELNSVLQKLPVGGVSQPVRSIGGYYILGLRDRQEPLGTKIVDPATQQKPEKPGYLPLARLLLPLPPKAPKNYVDGAMKAGAQIRQAISSCDRLAKIAQGIKGSIYNNLGEMKLSDLSADMQAALAKTVPGEPTEPFMSSAGMEIIARCDKPLPKPTQAFKIPSRDDVERTLFQQQISMLARRYIRDLRREANVETR